jgi:hypothetical protein
MAELSFVFDLSPDILDLISVGIGYFATAFVVVAIVAGAIGALRD